MENKMKTEQKADYAHLEGKIINYEVGGHELEAIVAGVEYDIGITIKATDNPKNNLNEKDATLNDMRKAELSCLHGEASPYGISMNYDKHFNFWVEQIELSNFSVTKCMEFEAIVDGTSPGLGAVVCAFGA